MFTNEHVNTQTDCMQLTVFHLDGAEKKTSILTCYTKAHITMYKNTGFVEIA